MVSEHLCHSGAGIEGVRSSQAVCGRQQGAARQRHGALGAHAAPLPPACPPRPHSPRQQPQLSPCCCAHRKENSRCCTTPAGHGLPYTSADARSTQPLWPRHARDTMLRGWDGAGREWGGHGKRGKEGGQGKQPGRLLAAGRERRRGALHAPTRPNRRQPPPPRGSSAAAGRRLAAGQRPHAFPPAPTCLPVQRSAVLTRSSRRRWCRRTSSC